MDTKATDDPKGGFDCGRIEWAEPVVEPGTKGAAWREGFESGRLSAFHHALARLLVCGHHHFLSPEFMNAVAAEQAKHTGGPECPGCYAHFTRWTPPEKPALRQVPPTAPDTGGPGAA